LSEALFETARVLYQAAEPWTPDSGDTAWVLMSAALVMLMTPALGFFYGGLVRRKNVLSTIMHSFFILALISVQWVLWGYSLSFGTSVNGIIGGLDFIGFSNVGADSANPLAPTIPHQAFAMFQGVFAIITPALITGAFAERKRFKAFVIFSLLWATFVYAPVAHWVWGGGWIGTMGALDFAGGTVVHITSGASALVAAIVLGKRIGVTNEPPEPHDTTMTVLGAGLLWFGWFGFNAGSAVAAGGLAASAFATTNTAAAAAGLAWMTVSWMHHGRPSVLGLAVGAVAGLVAITPAAGFVTVPAAIIIGLLAGVVCYFAVDIIKKRFGVDDALDVVGVHGVGGTLGALATGLFATSSVNSSLLTDTVNKQGLFYGNPSQLVIQLIAVVVVWVFAAVVSWVILKLIDLTIGLRVPESEEVLGLDTTQHGEVAYTV
jgi:ammonium transporter, Amt family